MSFGNIRSASEGDNDRELLKVLSSHEFPIEQAPEILTYIKAKKGYIPVSRWEGEKMGRRAAETLDNEDTNVPLIGYTDIGGNLFKTFESEHSATFVLNRALFPIREQVLNDVLIPRLKSRFIDYFEVPEYIEGSIKYLADLDNYLKECMQGNSARSYERYERLNNDRSRLSDATDRLLQALPMHEQLQVPAQVLFGFYIYECASYSGKALFQWATTDSRVLVVHNTIDKNIYAGRQDKAGKPIRR